MKDSVHASKKKRSDNTKPLPPDGSAITGIQGAGLAEPSDMLPDDVLLGEKAARKAMNGTAYRIFLLLRRLMVEPMSLEEINRLFRAEPRIGKAISDDSVCFYINTLRAVGCRIRRPSAGNGFRYELLGHPFGLTLSEIPLETLACVKGLAQEQLSPQEMLLLDSLLKKVIRYSGLENPEEVIAEWFSRSRSLDYSARSEHLRMMERWIADKRLLRIRYLSPSNGEESFLFLPDALFYRQGAVYLHGERPEFAGPSGLRMDRVLSAEPADETTLRIGLESRRKERIHVMAHIFADSPAVFQGFDLGEHQEVYEARYVWAAPDFAAKDDAVSRAEGYYEAHWQVRDYFYLKRHLLGCGFPFRIITPENFREEMRRTLKTMQAFYEPDSPP